MKDIHEVLRQKQAKYAQLGKQIEMLQQAAEKLREVAPLLAESDEEDNVVLAEVDDATASDAMAAKAGAGSGSGNRFQGGAAYGASLAVIWRQFGQLAIDLMNLQALLVSSDDSAADVLGRVLSGFGIAMDRSSDPETTIARIQQQKFDALIVDFDDPAGGRGHSAAGPETGRFAAEHCPGGRYGQGARDPERRSSLCSVQTSFGRGGQGRDCERPRPC